MANRHTSRLPLSPEDQLLLCGAHPALNVERNEQLARLLTSRLNWSMVVDRADWHGIAPMLYRHISAASASIPRDALDALAGRTRACLAWNLGLHHELLRLLDLFNEACLPVIPLKGLYVGRLLYGDPLLRPTSDLDLLVQPAHVSAIESMLIEAGWLKLPAAQQGADYHVSYAPAGGGRLRMVIELHTGLGEKYVAGLDVETIWASASQTTWEGRTIWTMALPDLFLYLCLHAVKDGLASLRSLLDIALLLEQFGASLPWEDLGQRIETARIRMPIHLCLLQCRELLGAPVPDQFLGAIRPGPLPSRLLAHTLFQWRGGVLHASPSLLTGPVMALQMFLWEDSLRGKLRHLRRNLLPSANLRARWMSLSRSASPFRWYLAWMWEICRHLTRQLAVRPYSKHPDSHRS